MNRNFSFLLAKRYIAAQKRHSVLTVCSIAIAVALMTMFFTCYTTYNQIARDTCMADTPYHLMADEVTPEQARAIEGYAHVASVDTLPYPGSDTCIAFILLDGYVGDGSEYMSGLESACGLSTQWVVNRELMNYDGIDDAARFSAAIKISLFFILIIFVAFALRMMIDTAFEVSSKERERQFGVLQSIGASPGQIVRIMTWEGILDSAAGVPLGAGLGVGLAYAAYRAVLSSGVAEKVLSKKAQGCVHFHVSPLMTLCAMAVGLVWVFFSAYGTGMRVVKMSPVAAISGRANKVVKVKKRPLLGLLFGWKGKLASRNVRRNPKRFLITVLSLTVSITLFVSLGEVLSMFEQLCLNAMEFHDLYGVAQYDLEITTAVMPGQALAENYRLAAEKLEQTGYFTAIQYDHFVRFRAEGEDQRAVPIGFVNRGMYERFTAGTKLPDYDSFAASGKALAFCYEMETGKKFPAGGMTIAGEVPVQTTLTAEEYAARQEAGDPSIHMLDVDPPHYWSAATAPYTIELGWALDSQDDSPVSSAQLAYILPMEAYRTADFGDYTNAKLFLQVTLTGDDCYQNALSWLEHSEEFTLFDDRVEIMRSLSSQIAAFRIGGTFVNLMLALIALVNMINIVSTGVLNRKAELAAIQCSGMTPGQLYGTTVIECLQFALWSAVASGALIALLLEGTMVFMRGMTLEEELSAFLDVHPGMIAVKIIISAAVAFLTALAASLIPLHRMQSQPLVEQVRAVE